MSGATYGKMTAVTCRTTFVAIFAALALATPSHAEWSECGVGKRITCVVDGDTIWSKGEKIRLMGFDSPEKGNNAKCQRERLLADKATLRLQKILNSGRMSIERKGKDRYRRTLAIVRVRGENVGVTLIREGLAYAYKGGKRDRFRWCR